MTYFIGPFFLFVFCRMLFLSLVFLQSRESKSKNTYIKKKNIKVCISVEKYKTTNIFSLHKMAKLDKLFFPETRVNVLLIKYWFISTPFCPLLKFIYSENATKFAKSLPLFEWHYIGKIYGGDFAKFCGLLKIYGLYI